MSRRTTRRRLLGAAASASALGIAGCASDEPANGTPTDTDDGNASPADDPGTGTTDTETADGTGTTDEQTATDTETPDEDGEYRNGVGEDASVSLSVPADGATITSPYVQWDATAEGVTIEEAGAVSEGAGHYHLIVDADPVTPGETIPNDDQHVHYGTGQTDGVLELEPGEHTIHLQVGDGAHTAMALTDTVDVTVSDEASLDLSTEVSGSVVDWEITATSYTIEPASEGVNSNAGHLHAIIDTEHVEVGEVIPTDDRHVHYGDGSTSGSIDLAERLGDDYEPGEHTIHFQVGSGSHRATMVHAHTTVTTES